MFDFWAVKYGLIDVPYSLISAYFTWWVNIFNLNIWIFNVIMIGFIIILYVAYVLKYNAETSLQKSYKEFIIRTVIVLWLTILFFWKDIFWTPLQIIEWNVYTHNAIKENMSESAQFSSQDIFNKQYIVEWVWNAKKTKIQWIWSYLENGNNFYIDTKAPINVKFEVIDDIESYIKDSKDSWDLWIKTSNEWWTKTITNLNTPINVAAIENSKLEWISLNTTIIADGKNKLVVSNAPQFAWIFDENFKKTYFWTTTYLNDFWNAVISTPTNNTTYYVVDDSDLWIMKIMKVYKNWNEINITFYITPNLYTLQLDKTAWKSNNLTGEGMKIYKWYKEQLTSACVSWEVCDFYDIYKQRTNNKEFKVNDFISAFSLMNWWFNSSVVEDKKYTIRINWNEIQSFVWFFDNISKFEWRLNAVSNSFNGMNYVNSKYVVSYVADTNDEVQRNVYWLWVYSDNSFFKNFYVTPIWNWEIWFWETIAWVLFLWLFFVVYIFWNFFIVFVVYQILN